MQQIYSNQFLIFERKKLMKEHKGMGFKAAAKNIQKKEGVSAKSAGAILASASRKNKGTSKNKNLKKVKG